MPVMTATSDAVDRYLQTAPETGRAFFQGVRELVLRHAPDATETLSYNMPTFLVDGHRLLHASAWKEHLAIYPLPPAEDLDAEAVAALEAHSSGASTLKLLYREEFPTLLVDAVVRAHLARLAAGR
jgi:uncharacterized protein YdhG (YjbR/CyaY superfamily)